VWGLSPKTSLPVGGGGGDGGGGVGISNYIILGIIKVSRK
jgi:hypothetical protein